MWCPSRFKKRTTPLWSPEYSTATVPESYSDDDSASEISEFAEWEHVESEKPDIAAIDENIEEQYDIVTETFKAPVMPSHPESITSRPDAQVNGGNVQVKPDAKVKPSAPVKPDAQVNITNTNAKAMSKLKGGEVCTFYFNRVTRGAVAAMPDLETLRMQRGRAEAEKTRWEAQMKAQMERKRMEIADLQRQVNEAYERMEKNTQGGSVKRDETAIRSSTAAAAPTAAGKDLVAPTTAAPAAVANKPTAQPKPSTATTPPTPTAPNAPAHHLPGAYSTPVTPATPTPPTTPTSTASPPSAPGPPTSHQLAIALAEIKSHLLAIQSHGAPRGDDFPKMGHWLKSVDLLLERELAQAQAKKEGKEDGKGEGGEVKKMKNWEETIAFMVMVSMMYLFYGIVTFTWGMAVKMLNK